MNNKDYSEMPEVPREDYDDERGEKAYKGCFWSLVLAVVVIIVAAMMGSCTTTKVVEVERVKTDTTYITKWQRDSVWLHDSIHVTERGDTIRIERWHTKYIEKQVHDTTYVATHDTIPKPYEVVKEVPAELSWWQRVRLWLGNAVLLAVIGFAGYWIFRIYRVWKLGL